jgi:hypothetical protein
VIERQSAASVEGIGRTIHDNRPVAGIGEKNCRAFEAVIPGHAGVVTSNA